MAGAKICTATTVSERYYSIDIAQLSHQLSPEPIGIDM